MGATTSSSISPALPFVRRARGVLSQASESASVEWVQEIKRGNRLLNNRSWLLTKLFADAPTLLTRIVSIFEYNNQLWLHVLFFPQQALKRMQDSACFFR